MDDQEETLHKTVSPRNRSSDRFFCVVFRQLACSLRLQGSVLAKLSLKGRMTLCYEYEQPEFKPLEISMQIHDSLSVTRLSFSIDGDEDHRNVNLEHKYK